MTSYRTELSLIVLVRVMLIASMTLALIHSIIPVPVAGSLVFWLTYIANPFLVLYLLVKDCSIKESLLVILCGGWLNHLGISLTLMYVHGLTSSSLVTVFFIESGICLLLSIAPGLTGKRASVTIPIELSMPTMTKSRALCLLAVFLTGVLPVFYYSAGLYNPFADTVDLWGYLNPITLSIVAPIAIGVYFLSRNGAGRAEVISLYVVGLIIRILPNLFFGPVWESDVFLHQYYSGIFLQFQLDAFPVLYSEMSVLMYPLLSFHILTAAGLALTGNLWFFPQWMIFNHTVLFISVLKLYQRSGPRAQLFAMFLYTVFPTLIRYFSLPRPYEIVSGFFAVAVTLVILSETEFTAEKKRVLAWCLILLVIGSSAHVFGLSILLVVLAFVACNMNTTLTVPIGNRLKSVSMYLPRLLVIFLPFLLITIFFLIPADYLVTPIPNLTRMLQNIRLYSSGPSDFSVWLESLSLNALTANVYSTFVAFFPLVGFVLNIFLLYGPAPGNESLLHGSRHRALVLYMSIQILFLWFVGFFFMPLVISGRVGVHLGWIVLSLGMVAILAKVLPRNQLVSKSRKALQMFLVLFLSFGLVVGHAPTLAYDSDDFEMASWTHENLPADSGIACSTNVRKLLLAFGHQHVRVNLGSWTELIEDNFSYMAVAEFIEAGYPDAINFTVSFAVISSHHPMKGFDQTHLVTQMEHSPYFQLVGLGSTWMVFEIRLD